MSRYSNRIRVLASGRSAELLVCLEDILDKQPDVEFSTRQIVNGTRDPIQGVREAPDVLIMDLGDDWKEQLSALKAHPVSERPAVIALGDAANAAMMREAMTAGVRDFLTHNFSDEELVASLRQLASEKRQADNAGHSHLTAVINAKGGSGASFVACNLAHIMAAELNRKTGLFDLDMQFGTLPLYLDLVPRTTLIDTLTIAEDLDAVALESCMTKHASGLYLLSAMSEHLGMPWEIPEASLNHIVNLATENFDQIVVDLPRQIDPLTSNILERADNVVVVVQQSLSHIRDGKRLLQLIGNELGVPREAIKVVVNRYSEKDAISLQDIRQSVKHDELITVPNDFNNVSQSVNTGQPMLEFAGNSVVTRVLRQVASDLAGITQSYKPNVLQRAVSLLFNRSGGVAA